MSGNAFLLTTGRLSDKHYLEIALREARDMHKPPITLQRFWKNTAEYEDVETQLNEVCRWLERSATMGDYVALEGDTHCVQVVSDFAKKHRMVPVQIIRQPEDAIRDL